MNETNELNDIEIEYLTKRTNSKQKLLNINKNIHLNTNNSIQNFKTYFIPLIKDIQKNQKGLQPLLYISITINTYYMYLLSLTLIIYLSNTSLLYIC